MKPNNRKRILLVAERKDELFEWLSHMMRDDFEVEELYLHSDVFIAPFFLKRLVLVIRRWISVSRYFKPHKVIVYGKAMTTIWVIVLLIRLFHLNVEIILFRYDVEYLRPFPKGPSRKIGHFVTKKLEKYCFLNADKIIHKGLKNELELLPFYGRIRHKPSYLFREFIDPKLIQNCKLREKLSSKDDEFHLVTHGALPLVNLSYSDSIWEFYPKITRQKIHLHIYIKLDAKTANKLKKIEESDPYFHYGGYLGRKKLLKEIARYDYGLYLTSWNRGGIENNYSVTTAIGYRIFDYISAHIPIIASDDSTAVVELIDKSDIGFHIPYEKIHSLKNILEKNRPNYKKMVKNMDRTIKNLANHEKFLKFLGTGSNKRNI